MVPTRLEPRIGGEVRFDVGAATPPGVVTDYTPGLRFAIEEPWPLPERLEDVPPGMAETTTPLYDALLAHLTGAVAR